MVPGCPKFRLRLGDFFVKMCEKQALLRLILPVPVSLNRFAADFLVFIFGITFSNLLF